MAKPMTKIPFLLPMKSPALVSVCYRYWLVAVVVVVAAAVFCICQEQQLAVPASAVVSSVGLDRPGPQAHDDDQTEDTEESSSWYCASDLACNLNGRCVLSDHHNNNDGARNNNNCVCDQGWIGVNCSTLDLIPTASNSGYRPVDRSSWGASVWYEENEDEENDKNSGRYYMIAAEMVEHCGLTSWRTHSKTILATSNELVGPYQYHSTIVGLWTHNPTVVKLPAAIWKNKNKNNGRSSSSSSYVLYAAGYGDGQTSVPLPCYPSGCCTNGTSPCGINELHGCNSTSPPWPHPPPPDPDHYRDPDGSYQNISLWHADRLRGPWRRHWANFVPNNVTSHQYTPAAWAFPNGTIVLLLAGGGLFRANHWQGPYSYWGAGKDLYWGCQGGEDPFLYVDTRGHWHCLYHAAPYPNLTVAGGHAFSVDGTTWHTTPNAAYRGDYIVELITKTTTHQNGTTPTTADRHQEERKLILGKRERPHLVFDEQRNILALVTGVCVSPANDDDDTNNIQNDNEQQRWALCNNNPWPGYYDKTFTHVQRVRQRTVVGTATTTTVQA
jgi:hypothetical protein